MVLMILTVWASEAVYIIYIVPEQILFSNLIQEL